MNLLNNRAAKRRKGIFFPFAPAESESAQCQMKVRNKNIAYIIIYNMHVYCAYNHIQFIFKCMFYTSLHETETQYDVVWCGVI